MSAPHKSGGRRVKYWPDHTHKHTSTHGHGFEDHPIGVGHRVVYWMLAEWEGGIFGPIRHIVGHITRYFQELSLKYTFSFTLTQRFCAHHCIKFTHNNNINIMGIMNLCIVISSMPYTNKD